MLLTSIGAHPDPAHSVAFPSKDSVTNQNAQFLATIWKTQRNANEEIEWNGGYLCGAALVSTQFLLTAAHCIVDKRGELRNDLVVMAGEEKPILGEALSVFDWIIHPRFSLKTGANDIAVALLNHDSRFGSKEPLKIASKFKKNRTWLYGWGMDQNKQKPSVAKRILQDDYTKYGTDFFEDFNPRTMIAAGYQLKKEKLFGGACFGDSGSPLVVMNGSQPELLGIVSNGADTCDSRVPSVYTRLSYYKDFINDSVEELQNYYTSLGLSNVPLDYFNVSYSAMGKGKILPWSYKDDDQNTAKTSVTLQTTTKSNTFAYSDIFSLEFEASGNRKSKNHKWLIRVLLRAGKDACEMRSESETRISIGSGLPTYLSYTFLIPRERDMCFDISSKSDYTSTEGSDWFSVAPSDKALFDQRRCEYPSYRPLMMREFWNEANPELVGGWVVKLDPKCQKNTSFGPFIRVSHYNYRTQLSDLEPGLGMWIGPFRTES